LERHSPSLRVNAARMQAWFSHSLKVSISPILANVACQAHPVPCTLQIRHQRKRSPGHPLERSCNETYLLSKLMSVACCGFRTGCSGLPILAENLQRQHQMLELQPAQQGLLLEGSFATSQSLIPSCQVEMSCSVLLWPRTTHSIDPDGHPPADEMEYSASPVTGVSSGVTRRSRGSSSIVLDMVEHVLFFGWVFSIRGENLGCRLSSRR
jgi:hypothetical protein